VTGGQTCALPILLLLVDTSLGRAFSQRPGWADPGSLPRRAVDRQLAAQMSGAGCQDLQPEMRAAVCGGCGRIKSTAIVRDVQPALRLPLLQLQRNFSGSRVTAGVDQRFLYNPQDLAGVFRWQEKGPLHLDLPVDCRTG